MRPSAHSSEEDGINYSPHHQDQIDELVHPAGHKNDVVDDIDCKDDSDEHEVILGNGAHSLPCREKSLARASQKKAEVSGWALRPGRETGHSGAKLVVTKGADVLGCTHTLGLIGRGHARPGLVERNRSQTFGHDGAFFSS